MLSNLKIPRELRRLIDNELQPGEFIRWVEQPIPRFFTAASIASILFGIPWTSFAIFWMWGASGFKLPDLREGLPSEHLSILLGILVHLPFVLIGIGFVLLGFGLLFSPFWLWQAARNQVYLVTDKRALWFLNFCCITTIRSHFPDQLKDIYRKERADGTGDVIFSSRCNDSDLAWDSGGNILSIRRLNDRDVTTRGIIRDIVTWKVRNPREVENLLKQLAQNNV